MRAYLFFPSVLPPQSAGKGVYLATKKQKTKILTENLASAEYSAVEFKVKITDCKASGILEERYCHFSNIMHIMMCIYTGIMNS